MEVLTLVWMYANYKQGSLMSAKLTLLVAKQWTVGRLYACCIYCGGVWCLSQQTASCVNMGSSHIRENPLCHVRRDANFQQYKGICREFKIWFTFSEDARTYPRNTGLGFTKVCLKGPLTTTFNYCLMPSNWPIILSTLKTITFRPENRGLCYL